MSLKRLRYIFSPLDCLPAKLKLWKRVVFDKNVTIRRAQFEGNNYVYRNASVKDSFVGFGTYIGNGSRLTDVRCGRFCSIADNLKTGFSAHPTTQNITTSLPFYMDVRKTRKDEMYLSITESKKVVSGEGEEAQVSFEKHKIFLYREDFSNFIDGLTKTIKFIHQSSMTTK